MSASNRLRGLCLDCDRFFSQGGCPNTHVNWHAATVDSGSPKPREAPRRELDGNQVVVVLANNKHMQTIRATTGAARVAGQGTPRGVRLPAGRGGKAVNNYQQSVIRLMMID